ncbi:MAG: hypothetical protein CFE21_01435 [Bacteroidetes bacterium B1(2017)]|nr:MAG: hypothetical protein CFE21_01435 [Bacteroidetes bacterium B1(2017)]
MKKLLLLGAFVAFGYMGVNAQSVSAAPSNDAISVATPSDDKPAKSDKKEKKDKKDHKSCGDEKEKCKSGEKKSCCSDKGHKEETPAKKEDNK